MFHRLTDQARAALVAARETAYAAGRSTIDSADLLRGLATVPTGVAGYALADLGVRLPDLATPIRQEGAGESYLPFTPELKRVLEAAHREAVGLRHLRMTTGRLLSALAAVPESAGAPLLVTAGVDVASIRAAVRERHNRADAGEAEPGAEGPGVVLPDLSVAAVRARRPLAAALLLSLAWYAATIVLLAATCWPAADLGLLAGLLVGGPAVVTLFGLVRRPGPRLARALATAPDRLPVPPGIAAALARAGVTAVEVRVDDGVRARDRCHRSGRRAWIVLSVPTLTDPGVLPFVLGHEVAHVLRNDHLRGRVHRTFGAAAVLVAAASLDRTAVAIALAGALLQHLATSWWAELRCDALAARWAGGEPFRAWATATEHRGWHRVGRWWWLAPLRALPSLFSHPPMALRLAMAAGPTSRR